MTEKTITVTNDADYRTALEAGYTPQQIKIGAPDNTAALNAARAEGLAAGKAEAQTAHEAALKTEREQTAKAERERIAKLQSLARPGFDAELKAAIEGGHTPEQFALKQMDLANERGITLDSIKKDSTHAAGAPNEGAHHGGAKTNLWDQATTRAVSTIKANAERTGAKLKLNARHAA